MRIAEPKKRLNAEVAWEKKITESVFLGHSPLSLSRVGEKMRQEKKTRGKIGGGG